MQTELNHKIKRSKFGNSYFYKATNENTLKTNEKALSIIKNLVNIQLFSW